MGRGKPTALSLILDTKKRVQTFEKRKKGLEKKAHELSTLCAVNISMIMFGPDDVAEGTTNNPTIWPEDLNVTNRMISMYEDQQKADRHCRRNSSVASFYQDRISLVEREVVKLKKQNMKDKYPVWHESYDMLSSDQLLEFGNELDNVLHVLKSKIDSMEAEQVSQAISSSGNRGKELEIYPPFQSVNSFNYVGNEFYGSKSYSMDTHQLFQQIPPYGNWGNELENYYPFQGLNSFNCFGNDGAFAVDNSQTMRIMGESSSYYNNYNNNNNNETTIDPASFDHMIPSSNYYYPTSGENNNNMIMNQPSSEYTWYAQQQGQMQQVFMPQPLQSVDASQMVNGGIGDQWVGGYNFPF